MSVGYGELLTHLPTKYRTRRSDIIVSSTLSITLVPADSEYRVKDLCLIKNEEIDRWCDIRSLYRASMIATASYKDRNNFFSQSQSMQSPPISPMNQGQNNSVYSGELKVPNDGPADP